MNIRLLLPLTAILPVVVLSACSTEMQPATAQELQEAPVYVAAEYDPARNPEDDLNEAVKLAQSSGKRILIEVGGSWCSWCRALDRFIHENRTVAGKLEQDFLVLKVNYSEENRNESFLSRFPEIPGYPHLFVLDADGSFLYSQSSAPLEEGKSYSEEAFMAFLNEWSPRKS